MARSRYIYREGKLTEVWNSRDGWVDAGGPSGVMVMPDIEPFVDNTGTYIGGRRQWKEHLQANNLNELSREDVMNLRHAPPKVDAQARKEGIIAAVREIKSGRNPNEVAAVLRERLYRR